MSREQHEDNRRRIYRIGSGAMQRRHNKEIHEAEIVPSIPYKSNVLHARFLARCSLSTSSLEHHSSVTM
jgi:hypothetical protein